MRLTVHGIPVKKWSQVHKDYKNIIKGTKYVLVMDATGATTLMPWSLAKKERLI